MSMLFKRTVATVLTLAMILGCFAASTVSVSAASALPLTYADVNRDGAADSRDVLTLYRAVSSGDDASLGREARLCADCDGSSSLTMKDVQILFAAVSGKTALSAATPAPSEFELEVFRLVNIEREKEGLAPLQYAYDLQLLADIRADECIEYFSHTRPDGRLCFSVFEDHGIPLMAGGENIALYHSSPEEVVDGWMNSPGHRANILYPDYTTIVVGCLDVFPSTAPGFGYSWVQLFCVR